MKYLTLAFLLLFSSAGFTSENADGKHPQTHLKQFQKQCFDATGNRPMCKCAVRAFKKQAPPHEARLGHHSDVNLKALRVADEYIAILEDDIVTCEALHPTYRNGLGE